MSEAAEVIRSARIRSGLTQAQLAERLRTSQSAVARLERPGANPTVATLRRALAAADHGLKLDARPRPPSVDLPQLLRHMRMTPAERLAAHEAAYDNMRAMLAGSAGHG
ncbi:MAG: helix-turn-helix transcriptional regulator [Thermoleophilaceae bacterium]|nr:helix-turn-helix transcriptional regulator [Thermoleophilaceae bacterium]